MNFTKFGKCETLKNTPNVIVTTMMTNWETNTKSTFFNYFEDERQLRLHTKFIQTQMAEGLDSHQ